VPLLTIILLTLFFFPFNALAESKIAFFSNRDGNHEIYTMNPDGTNQTRLTNIPAGDTVPAWSQDGTKIVFDSKRDGNYEIYVMNSDGSNQTRLTNNSTDDRTPSWSPTLYSIQLPRTGQTTCYDSAGTVIPCAGAGQDGEIQAGVPWPSPRFTDNGDLTVTDNLTGLMWTKDANFMVTRDPGFDVDGALGNGAVTWQHALDYIDKLNAEAYQGNTDWRLPNRKELLSLIDRGRYVPALPAGHPFTNIDVYLGHWSSTSASGGYSSNAWAVVVSGGDGAMNYPDKDMNVQYIWPVRGGQVGPVVPPPTEICDGIDNDGDTLIDEDFPTGNTSCGSNVPVAPDGVTFTFSTVTMSGDTTVTTSGTGQPTTIRLQARRYTDLL